MKVAKVPTPEPDEEFAKFMERSRAELKRQAKRTDAPRALQEVMDALREDYYQANPDGDFADHLAQARAMFRQDG